MRRSNCRAFFPQLAKWYDELAPASFKVFRRVGQAVTIALRRFGKLPEGALDGPEVPYGTDTGERVRELVG
eukprot:15375242-Alexandrium_andersonii.AAC.1